MIGLEELNVMGMMQNYKLAWALGDVGLGQFSRQMSYKYAGYGITVQRADRWYPSSKRCSGCGQVKASLLLSERVYRYETCGLELNRDLNAARNLVQLSEKTTASSAGSEACGKVALAAR